MSVMDYDNGESLFHKYPQKIVIAILWSGFPTAPWFRIINTREY